MKALKVKRRELKYYIRHSDYLVLSNVLKKVMSPDPYSKEGGYFVRSLYFDDLDDRAFHQKIAGIENRKKFTMKQYLDMVRYVLENGVKSKNRTGVKTFSCFAYFYKVNLEEGYPLLTTKQMYFNSMLHELFWYLSGEAHIKTLREILAAAEHETLRPVFTGLPVQGRIGTAVAANSVGVRGGCIVFITCAGVEQVERQVEEALRIFVLDVLRSEVEAAGVFGHQHKALFAPGFAGGLVHGVYQLRAAHLAGVVPGVVFRHRVVGGFQAFEVGAHISAALLFAVTRSYGDAEAQDCCAHPLCWLPEHGFSSALPE